MAGHRMIEAFDALAAAEAQQQADMAELLSINAALLEALKRLAGFAAHYAPPTALAAGGNHLLEVARAAIARAEGSR